MTSKEALEIIKENLNDCNEYFNHEEEENNEIAIAQIEEDLEVLDTLKTKEVNVEFMLFCLWNFDNALYEYNFTRNENVKLTQEEFMKIESWLKKEWLEDEK